MNRQIEKRLAARAVELGRAGLGVGLAELAGLVKKESVEVRRLAVSAVGKLAGAADCQQAVEKLLKAMFILLNIKIEKNHDLDIRKV